MKHLLLAAFLSALLLDAPNSGSDDDPDPDDGDMDQDEQEPTFADHLQAAATGAAFLGEHETAKWFSEIEDPAELLDPEAAGHIAKLRQAGTSGRSLGASGERLADDLTVIADTEHQAKEVREEEAAKKSRTDRKEFLRSQWEQDRTTKAAQGSQEALDRELLAEIEAEAGGGPPTTSPEDEQLRIFEEAHAVATDMSKPIEERAAAAEKGIAAAAILEATPFVPDRAALDKAAAERLKKIQEG